MYADMAPCNPDTGSCPSSNIGGPALARKVVSFYNVNQLASTVVCTYTRWEVNSLHAAIF
jgi:hypothetical protein